ncbi:amino acid permease [Acidianus sulfidivorans JP7]|uniref:APC family permease n=1 Tax=Acidianus sulfidivorans JP7 TaxID=619593 RepID=A0A2U9ILF6_9CREN|nr:APC family permease [Acidianus sulfidivorans]AWR96856.1 amino acid permease [Acidianus sulfidivorans JP7]
MEPENRNIKKEEKETDLPKGILSPWFAMANGLASNAPAAVTALYFVGLASLVGGSLPLVVVLAWLIYLSMTYIVYNWSKNIAASYGWAAIQKKGFNNSYISFVIGGWGYWFYYMLASTGFGVLGLATFLSLLFPSVYSAYPWIWIPLSLAIIAETSTLMYLGIKTNSKYTLYTGLAEILFIVITSIILIIKAGPHNTIVPFTPIPLGANWAILLTSMIFGITTFGGMNSSIPVAEETADPKKNIPKSLVMLALILGLPIILNSYAQVITYGISNMFNYANLADPGIIIYDSAIGSIAGIIFAIFIINSFNSSTIGFGNSQIRTVYGMARDSVVFPKLFTEINKYGVPGKNIIIMSIVNAVLAITSGLIMGPLNASIFLITANAFYSFLNHLLGAIGLIRYNKNRGTLKITHVIIAGIVVVALGAAIILSAFAPPPLDYAGLFALSWFIAGSIIYLIEKKRNPEKIKRFGDYSL